MKYMLIQIVHHSKSLYDLSIDFYNIYHTFFKFLVYARGRGERKVERDIVMEKK